MHRGIASERFFPVRANAMIGTVRRVPWFRYDIFLSYARTETATRYVQALRDLLLSEGFTCFLDTDEAGSPVDTTLQRAIHRSVVLLV